eukprot:TRINITY_DN10904_c0_g2_i2.p3 TRINITY_DN10904_c0_g2~~TRINITY_DN10904_c0_g2_i2.p3  ORF type:complete len:101 (+),score=1.90 TRINITY_DN10904_c0_g2_i2:773-1075(+)
MRYMLTYFPAIDSCVLALLLYIGGSLFKLQYQSFISIVNLKTRSLIIDQLADYFEYCCKAAWHAFVFIKWIKLLNYKLLFLVQLDRGLEKQKIYMNEQQQ